MALFPLMIPALAQAGIGLVQNIAGNRRAKNLKRPERTTPQAVQEAVARSRYAAQGGDTLGSSQARQNIASTQAATISQAGKAGGSAASTMAAAIAAQGQANKATQRQDMMDQQYRQQANMQYLNQLQGLAREQAANWQWNEAQKFQEEADAARRLQESGMQNLFGGMGEAAGLGFMNKMGYLNGAKDGGGFLKNLFGGGKNQMTTDMARAQGQQAVNTAMQNVGQLNIPSVYSPANTQGQFSSLPVMQYRMTPEEQALMSQT